MKKIIIFFNSLAHSNGTERALLNLLYALPKERYAVDLALYNGDGHLFHLIPPHVKVLPFLKQLQPYSPALMRTLREEGFADFAEMREVLHERAVSPEFKKLPPEKRQQMNWGALMKVCPPYRGYDVAVAFIGLQIDIKMVTDHAEAKKRVAFIHYDIQSLSCDGGETMIHCAYPYWQRMDHLIVLTEQSRLSLAGMFPDLASKIVVLPNISPAGFFRAEAERYYPVEFENAPFRIFTAARLTCQKGVDLVLDACRLLRDSGLDFCWVIAGMGHNDAYHINFMRDYEQSNLQDWLIIKDNLDNPFPYYKNCDLYVQPSRYEGRCLALEEARILGCALLATAYPSAGDIITDGENGVICGLDAQSIADAIISLAGNPPLRARLAEANRGYTGDIGVEKYVALFG